MSEHVADKSKPTEAALGCSAVQICPGCGAGITTDVFEAIDLPIKVGDLFDDPAAARVAPRGSITLAYCSHDGLLHNRHLNTDSFVFEPGYDTALHHSETFRNFSHDVANRLIDQYGLRGKRILEIGCGDGYFLRQLAELGGNDCLGIDPTIVREGDQSVANGKVTLIRDYFGIKYSTLEVDFICCLSVFEAIPNPGAFLAAIRGLMLKTNAPIYLEVFNGWRAIEQTEVWSIIYEQCNVFSLSSLSKLFEQQGFHVQQAGSCYAGDQYLFVEALATENVPERKARNRSPVTIPNDLLAFKRKFRERRTFWDQRLQQYSRDGERVVVWGAGGKGITFLNAVPSARTIDFVVEINPAKQGKYVPFTGQRIVPPEFLRDYRPSKIVITNPLYKDEIIGAASAMDIDAEFLVA